MKAKKPTKKQKRWVLRGLSGSDLTMFQSALDISFRCADPVESLRFMASIAGQSLLGRRLGAALRIVEGDQPSVSSFVAAYRLIIPA